MTIGVSKPLSLEAVGLLLYEVVFLRKETKMKSAPQATIGLTIPEPW